MELLQYADSELTTHNNGQVYKLIGDTIQAVFLGKVNVDQGLKDAQGQIDQILSSYKK